MPKQRRFRDIKQKRSLANDKKIEKDSKLIQRLPYASIGNKTKAFITDTFMLLMPLMYIVVYFVMDGLKDFEHHRLDGWLVILIPNFIIVFLFFWKSGQTPGCKAYNIKLVDNKRGEKAHPLAIALRYYFELFSMITIVGLLMAFFRSDRRALHDLLSGTTLIDTDDAQ